MIGEALRKAEPVPFLLDADADAFAGRLVEEVLLPRVVVTTVVAPVAVGPVEAEVAPWIWFLTVWLNVPVMPSRVNMEEKER